MTQYADYTKAFLSSKRRTASRCTHKCNCIYVHQKSTALHVPIFTNLTNSAVQCTVRSRNADRRDTDLFLVLCDLHPAVQQLVSQKQVAAELLYLILCLNNRSSCSNWNKSVIITAFLILIRKVQSSYHWHLVLAKLKTCGAMPPLPHAISCSKIRSHTYLVSEVIQRNMT